MKFNSSLFQNLQVRKVEIPNRLVLAPINTGYTDADNAVSERLVRFHETIAAGGVGLSVVGSTAVAKSGQVNQNELLLCDDSNLIALKALINAIKEQGSVTAIQLMHAGRQTRSAVTGSRPVAPSAIPCPVKQELPRELTGEEIHETVLKFSEAAHRAVRAGAQIIELHGAHGYLIGEFVSPYSNKRHDEYGGALSNRLRFPEEVIKQVRKKVGDSVPIMYRHSVEEFVEGGITLTDSLRILPALVEAGVDIISVSAGVYASRDRIIPPHPYGPALYADLARAIKKVVKVPVVVAGNFWDLETAEQIIAQGYADLVAMGRALIADPMLIRKTIDGKPWEIVRCTGCGICDYGLHGRTYMTCPVNRAL